MPHDHPSLQPHPPSLWATTAVPPPALEPLDGDAVCDLAVIGGGFTGLSTALHAAERGISVVLLESNDVGWGASGRNGGQVNPNLRVTTDYLVRRFGKESGQFVADMAAGAPDFLFALVARLGLNCGARRSGIIKLAHTAKAAEALKPVADSLAREGIAARLLGRSGVMQVVGTERYVAGLIDPRAGCVQPLSLARELARAALRAGAKIYVRSPAIAIKQDGARWHVSTPAGTVVAAQVIVATNAYTDTLIPGLRETVLPVNSFQIATAPLDEALAKQVLSEGHTAHDTRRLILYFRKDDQNRVVLGGRASFDSRAATRRDDYAKLVPVLTGLFPILRDVPVELRWTGLVAITRDHMPHVHAPAPGLHVALGYNGRGVALSVAMGKLLSERAAGGTDPFPVTPIEPIPFHRWREPALNAIMQFHRVMDLLGQ